MQTRSVVEEQALDKNCVQLLQRCLQKIDNDYYLHEAAMEKARLDDNRILILIRMLIPLQKLSERDNGQI